MIMKTYLLDCNTEQLCGRIYSSAEYAASIFRSSEIWASAHETTRRQNPEDHNINGNRRKNLTTWNEWLTNEADYNSPFIRQYQRTRKYI
jgi:hypothetical protein